MIHTLFIIDKNGEIIIERHWRGRVSRGVGEKFWEEVKKTNGKPEHVPPVISTPKHYIVHIHKNDLFFVGVVHGETPPLMIIDLLHKLVETFEKYIGKLSEFAIKQNFVTIYQLLDEMIDNGFPITTELSLLQDLVKPPQSILQAVGSIVQQPSSGTGRSPVPWRKLGIRYSSNEVFFDIVEELNCIIDVNGMVTFGEIFGTIHANCRLSGMPDLLMQFKDPSLIDDCSFHPCVRYARFEQDRSVSFVPPDGAFDLLTYRITNVTLAPLYCRPQIIFHPGGININIMTGLKPTNTKPLEDVAVMIPLPAPVDQVRVNCSVGSMTVDNTKKFLRWEIGKLNLTMKDTPSASGSVSFASRQENMDSGAGVAVLVNFKIPTLALSDVKVDAVHIKNEKYKPFKGVRYLAQAGRFEVRTC